MLRGKDKKMIELGIQAGDREIYEEDKIWSCYSSDKVDIGEELAKVLRTLDKALPLSRKMRALSVGSSNEPQFRILETAFRGGLYLLDLEKAALDIVKERTCRQRTTHVVTILADYNKVFASSEETALFLKRRLDGRKVDLITLHHSLYYCEETAWHTIIANLYRRLLAAKGAMHIVLMSAKSDNEYTTTWIYNHFVGKFFGLHNNQDLLKFKRELEKLPLFKQGQILSRTNKVYFFTEDFEKFMAVIWMILLYPAVHQYTDRQKEEITEFIYKKFWQKRQPLLQMQNHMAIYRGLNFKGMI